MNSRGFSMSCSCDMRYLGQEHSVTVSLDLATATLASLLSDFHETHERTYTFRLEDTPVEFVTYRLKARARVPRPEIRKLDYEGRSAEAAFKGRRMVRGGYAEVPFPSADRAPLGDHLRFAQSRAFGRKVSDEFTVPLCRRTPPRGPSQ